MRILWLCNICPPAIASALGISYSVREGWITGALNSYLEGKAGEMELGICFPAEGELDGVPAASFQKIMRMRSWKDGKESRTVDAVGPKRETGAAEKEVFVYGFAENLKTPEVYEPVMEQRFREILADFQPELVHIFGTEFPHALAMERVFERPERTLVGLQGMVGECAKAYMADLPETVQRRVTFRDIVRRDSMRQQQEKFYLRAKREKEVLESCGHVTGRTEFDRKASLACNPKLQYHKMNETMRSVFYEGSWSLQNCNRYEIFISQGDYPLKGFHYLLEAMPEILKEFPDAHITVAGNSITGYATWKEKLKISGYGKYLRECMQKWNLSDKVKILGRLDAEQMKAAFLNSHVFVCCSSVENSPNSLGEAMLLGVPCTASRAGGIPDMAEDGVSALYFEKGNVRELADRICRIFRENALAEKLSREAAKQARITHNGETNNSRLLEIYREILNG